MQNAQLDDVSLRVKPSMFGGNILSTADRFGEGTFDDKAKVLGITGLRYPGGSLTEDFFDIKDPDAQSATSITGRTTELIPLTDFLNYANQEGYPVTLVVPTRFALTEGSFGARDVSAAYLRDLHAFVTDVLKGKYGFADIDAFEIGNEYWGSGQMTSLEYGIVASAFSSTIQRAIDDFRALLPDATRFDEPLIAVQIGQRGQKETMDSNTLNRIVMGQFDANEARAVDAIVAHYYTDDQPVDYLRSENRFNRMKAWEGNPAFGDLKLLVTEWNVASPNSSQLGIRQPASLIAMFSEMIYQGVDAAHVWPIQQNTKNDLGGQEGSQNLTLGGEAYRLMSEILTDAIAAGSNVNISNGTYFFEKGSSLIVYVTSHTDTEQVVQLDLTPWTTRDSMAIRKQLTGDVANASADPRPVITEGSMKVEDGQVSLTLLPHAVVRLVIEDIDQKRGLGPDIIGTSRPDTLVGTELAEEIFGQSGNDRIDANDGNDTVYGGAGADIVTLGDGNDIYGKDPFSFELEGDRVAGQGGRDLMIGGSGADTFDGGVGSDTLLGAMGDDQLNGGHGNDIIHGGAGKDTITGGIGRDTLIGGLGADTFVLQPLHGNDIILDFERSDFIDLRALNLSAAEINSFISKHVVSGSDGLSLNVPSEGISLFLSGYDASSQELYGQLLL